MTSRELRQKLGELTDQYRKILDAGPAEKRSAEDNATLARLDTEMDGLEGEINRVDKQEKREAALVAPATRGIRTEVETADAKKGADEAHRARVTDYEKRFGKRGRQLVEMTAGHPTASPEYRDAFRVWLAYGDKGLSPEARQALSAGEAAMAPRGVDQRALSMGTATEGGYTVPSEEFLLELIKAVDDEAVIRQLARTFMVPNAQSLGVPTLSADPEDADWTTEIGTVDEDSAMAFGKREFRPNPVSKYLKVSNKLLRASPMGIEGIVRDRLGYKVGITHAKAFNTGDGASKPLGAYVASADGITSARDVEIGNGSGAVDPDKVIDARFTLKAGYWSRPSTRWHMHRNWLARFRKLKGSDNNYLWQPGLSQGMPSTFLDFPFVLDEYAPSVTTHAAGVYAAILGDWNNYWIVDALTTRIQRLDELEAKTRQVGFIIDAESDGAPVLAEAFVRLLAAT